MKILLLVAGGRGGSDFFQGLLDDHSQILQLPGYLRIDDEFHEMMSLRDPNKIAKRFIKIYPEYFNSRLNTLERHGQLGKNKNKFYKVNKDKFIKKFNFLRKGKKENSKIEILKDLHFAYSLAKGEKKCEKKILFVHTHLLGYTREFIKTFKAKNIIIIHTIRHPMASINSPIKNWLTFENGKHFFSKDLHFQLDLVFNGIFDLMNLKKKVYIIQYEKLHWENTKVMKDFCKIFKLKYEKCLKSSTYFGYQWWGDRISQRWVSGVNKKFKIIIDKKLFFERDLLFFQFLATRIIKFYNYEIFYPITKNYFNFMPMKCEILVWKNSLKHLRWKQILSIPFFYLIRLFIINKFMMKGNRLPYSIGSQKK